MSEYQFVEFRAVEGPVSQDNLEFLCEQSSRTTSRPTTSSAATLGGFRSMAQA